MLNKILNHTFEKTKSYFKSLLPEAVDESLTVKSFQILMERYVMSDFLTYGQADDEFDCIWLDDDPSGPNSMLLGYHISPLIMAGTKATSKIEKIIKRLPNGTVMTSIAHASDDIEGYLENWGMSRRHNQLPIYELITRRRINFLHDWCQGKINPMSRGSSFKPRIISHYLFVRIPADFKSYTKENITAHFNRIDKIHNTVTSQLQTAHIQTKRMKGSEMAIIIKNMANQHLNAKDNREVGINLEQSLAMQMIPSTTKHQVDEEGDLYMEDKITQSHKYVSVMFANKFSDQPHYLSDMQNCIGSILEANDFIPGGFYAFTIIEKQNAGSRVKDLTSKLAVANWHTTIDSEAVRKIFRHHFQLKQLIYDFMDDAKKGKGVVKVLCGLVLSANSKQELEDACAYAEHSWQAAGIELKKETSITIPSWLATLPGRYIPHMDGINQGLQRGVTMKSVNAATLTHVQGDWQGSHPLDGGMLLLSRRGTLSTLNLFKTFKSNYNALIAATSGSGKSFLMADLVSDFLARNGLVRGIDAGRSYFNLVETTGGQNVICESASNLCFNIFSTFTTKEMLDESLPTVTRLIAQMCFPGGYASEDDLTGQKPWEESYIAYMIETIWQEKHHQMSILDLYDYCDSHQADDVRIKDMVMLLYKWAKGHYAKWFIGKWNIHFENPFMIFEIDELKKFLDLQNVILNLLIARIADEMFYSWMDDQERHHGKITPKLLFIDEAWYLLARPNTARFIEELARRIRKYHGSLIIITQSFMDMNANSAAHAFIQNCNWIISLLQDIGTVKKAVDEGLLDLKDYALELLDTLHKTDNFSELYVINKSVKGEGVYRLVVDPASYWTYTTDGGDKSKLYQLINSGKTLAEAIDTLSTA